MCSHSLINRPFLISQCAMLLHCLLHELLILGQNLSIRLLCESNSTIFHHIKGNAFGFESVDIMLLCHFVHFDKFISHVRIAVLDFINDIRVIFCQLHRRRYGACRVLICCSNNEILLHITNLGFDRAKFSKLLLFGFDAFVGVNLIKKFQILLIVFVGRLRFFKFLTFLLILQLNQFHLIALHF